MKLFIAMLFALGLSALAGCSGSEVEYTAVYQVVPDAHVLYLGNRWYIAKDTVGGVFLIKMNEFGEVASMDRLF